MQNGSTSSPSKQSSRRKVLVLNTTFQPLNICTWKRAVKLLYKRKALVIESNGEKINGHFVLPLIVKLEKYVPIPYNGMVLSRKNIYMRDNYTCLYCGKTGTLTIDHVIPKSKGGQDTWSNMVACCSRCNNRKGDQTVLEAGMTLVREPYKPPSMLYLHMTRLRKVPSCWQDYFFSRN